MDLPRSSISRINYRISLLNVQCQTNNEQCSNLPERWTLITEHWTFICDFSTRKFQNKNPLLLQRGFWIPACLPDRNRWTQWLGHRINYLVIVSFVCWSHFHCELWSCICPLEVLWYSYVWGSKLVSCPSPLDQADRWSEFHRQWSKFEYWHSHSPDSDKYRTPNLKLPTHEFLQDAKDLLQ